MKLFSLVFLMVFSTLAQDIPEIKRRIPPAGINIPEKGIVKIKQELAKLKAELDSYYKSDKADVGIYYKAVHFALLHGEFYNKKDSSKALNLIKTAMKKLNTLKAGKKANPQKGIFTRGFVSEIDGSYQPYGIEIPESLDLSKPATVWIWLHGRGDKITDMHFIDKRDKAKFKFPKENVIVLHPLGRQCIGYKSAGETDILEMLNHVKENYKVDENRIAIMGFSMGGAGAWHLGAHYADKWAAVHAGAGFAETAMYNRLTKDKYPVWYEQKLWGVYDVPGYVRNLFNQPVVAYSGEVDKQIQAARVMEAAFKEHGKELLHLIGPKAGHKYAPGYLEKVADFVRKATDKGRDTHPSKVYLQTKTLKYNKMRWVTVTGLKEHWLDSRIDAQVKGNEIILKTKNISSLQLSSPWKNKDFPSGSKIIIDGTEITLSKKQKTVNLSHVEKWMFTELTSPVSILNKTPGLQGPIDDAFMSPFVVVLPSKKSQNAKFQRWMEFEIAHLKKRWRELFRGEVRIKKDSEVTKADHAKYNLILWGDSSSNSVIGKLKNLPIKWDSEKLIVNGKEYSSKNHVPTLIYPNGNKYIVLNSGPTFRENHDRTNSLQNPKLPDWAVIDINQNPNGDSAGKVVDANFFEEYWKFK